MDFVANQNLRNDWLRLVIGFRHARSFADDVDEAVCCRWSNLFLFRYRGLTSHI